MINLGYSGEQTKLKVICKRLLNAKYLRSQELRLFTLLLSIKVYNNQLLLYFRNNHTQVVFLAKK